jgi:uncharacterized membrane protein
MWKSKAKRIQEDLKPKPNDKNYEGKGLEERNKGLIIFGIILFAIGLVLYVYRDPLYRYPYQNGGTVLVVLGIILAVLGLLYPAQKTPPPPPPKA